ncbi:hypothetical protein [Ectopseudomonas guguanensis]|uniref:hypothetical protein n=1 Tax=Ectopseudomonas guguanensis TaxID=1198456 RepID=UPI0012F794D6|nr:hypothetical protein [Pseudomonas guguanensis]MDR8016199.1 hypothetical protein [Pseudomonas guguanensis]
MDVKRAVIVGTILLYVVSLALPALHTEIVFSREDGHIEPGAIEYGYYVLLVGWLGLFDTVAWYANPAFFIAQYLYANNRPSAFHVALASVALASTAVFYKKIWNDKEPPEIIVTELGIGFYVWLSALVLLTLATYLSRRDA